MLQGISLMAQQNTNHRSYYRPQATITLDTPYIVNDDLVGSAVSATPIPGDPVPPWTKIERAATFDSIEHSSESNDDIKRHEHRSKQALQRHTSAIEVVGIQPTNRRPKLPATRHLRFYYDGRNNTRVERSNRSDNPDRSDRYKSDRSDVLDRLAKSERSERSDKPDKSEKSLLPSHKDAFILDPRLSDRVAELAVHQDMKILDLERECAKREKMSKDLERECAKKEKMSKKLHQEVSDLAEDNEELQRKLEEQDIQIRAMQEQRLKELHVNQRFRAEDDDTIRHKIQSCMRRWQSWARDFALTPKEHIKDSDQRLAQDLFRSHVVSDELVAPNGLLSPSKKAIAPGIILNAALAEFIAQWIIQKPFFCLGHERNKNFESSEVLRLSEAFDNVYQHARLEGDESVAHLWRSQTLLMVNPSEQDILAGYSSPNRSAQKKEDYYRYLAKVFDASKARILYRSCDTVQRHKELLDIIRNAGDLFISLWKQKVFIESWGGEKFRKVPFSTESDKMMAHPTQYTENGEPRMNTRSVQMVVQPAIVAFGNEEGSNYREYKVWAKAVVWLSQ